MENMIRRHKRICVVKKVATYFGILGAIIALEIFA